MNKRQQDILGNLRKAAEQDQWNLCRENIKKLLPDLNQIEVLTIVVKQVRQFLSEFSRIHTQDETIRNTPEAFKNISSLEALSEQERLIDPLLEKYWDLPGVSNFRNVFKGITKPQQYFEHPGEFVDTVVSVLSGIFVAIEMNNYWTGNPEYSKLFFGPDVRKAVFMLAGRHSEPRNVEMRKSLWTELARDIEIALQSH